MLIALAWGHDQRVALAALVVGLVAVVVGIAVWLRQYRNPRVHTPRKAIARTQQPAATTVHPPVAWTNRVPAANAATSLALRERERLAAAMLKPEDRCRREPISALTTEEMAQLARFLLANYGKGDVKFTYVSTAYGVTDRAFACFSTDFAHLLNHGSMAKVPADEDSVNGFCEWLKYNKQFEEFLLKYAAPIRGLYLDYDEYLDNDTRGKFCLFEPNPWVFDYLLVAAASRDTADEVAAGVQASQLVLAVNFLLALDGFGLLGLHGKFDEISEIVKSDDYADFIRGLDCIIDVDSYAAKPEKLVLNLLQIFREKSLLELLTAHCALLRDAQSTFWGVCEMTVEYEALVPYLPQIELIEALEELHAPSQPAETNEVK